MDSDMKQRVQTFIQTLTPFKIAVAAFVTMSLAAIVILIAGAIALSEIKYFQHAQVQQQANQIINNNQQIPTQVVSNIVSQGISSHQMRQYLNNQVGVVILAAIILILSIAGIISGSIVIDEVTSQNEGREGAVSGLSSQDYRWVSSFGSIVLLQGIILMVVAVYSTVQYEHLMQETPLRSNLTPDEKKLKGVLMTQLILGYIGLLGGVVYYGAMRVAK